MRTPIVLLGVVAAVCTAACAPIPENLADFDLEDPTGDAQDEEQIPEALAPAEEPPAGEPRCYPGKRPTQALPVDASAADAGGVLKVQKDDSVVGLPLQETSFDTLVVGTVAETSVRQVFGNPFDEPIEAVYVFPLPDDGAVDDYWIHVGDRHIHGVMKRREEARDIYERARERGHTASLLEQERPNIFTQNVANIPPGESIEITMRVISPLHQEGGAYELALPTVVGPRYIPGTPTGKQAGGWAPDTDRVPDASRITPPVVPEGYTTCADLTVTVAIDAGMPIADLRSKFHSVTVDGDGDVSDAFVELAKGSAIPNRDFVLSWRLSGDAPRTSIMAQRDGKGGYFTMTVQPPATLAAKDTIPRELVFVVDNSGSMSGTPIETAKDAIRTALAGMRPDDAFTVMRFSETASALADGFLPATKSNVERGLAYVDEMRGMGGTQMLAGIRAALELPGNPDRVRLVLFLTDGYIGNEVEIFRAIESRIGDTRLFSLGVGSSVNRYLLEAMARVGRGAVTYMGPGEAPDEVVERFYQRIAAPAMTDIEIDWGDMKVDHVVPAKIPDLFTGQPVVVFGRFKGAPKGTATLRARLGNQRVRRPIAIDLAANDGKGHGLASMWARKRIDDLSGYPANRGRDLEQTRKKIVDLALRHRIMTEYTSFVAVDEQRVANPDGTYRTVQVPVEMPDGVSHEGVFGEEAAEAAQIYGHHSASKSKIRRKLRSMARTRAPSPKAAGGHGGMGVVGTGRGGGGTGKGTIGVGNTGLVGKGGGGGTGSGYGRGSGAGFGGRGKHVPRVRQAKAEVRGSIDRAVIRRIVRAHINEVRHCYNKGLTKDPNLQGRVVITFTIDAHGEVVEAKVTTSSLKDAEVGRCIADAIDRWTFPKPGDGAKVVVTYPFVLSPG